MTEPSGDFIPVGKVQRAAFERATTRVRKGKRGRRGLKSATEQFDSISRAQRKVRRGKLKGTIIDSTEKSKRRVRNELDNIRKRGGDVDDDERRGRRAL